MDKCGQCMCFDDSGCDVSVHLSLSLSPPSGPQHLAHGLAQKGTQQARGERYKLFSFILIKHRKQQHLPKLSRHHPRLLSEAIWSPFPEIQNSPFKTGSLGQGGGPAFIYLFCIYTTFQNAKYSKCWGLAFQKPYDRVKKNRVNRHRDCHLGNEICKRSSRPSSQDPGVSNLR